MNLYRISSCSMVASVFLLAGGASYAQAPAAVPVVNEFAGNGTNGYSGDGGLATQAQLNNPSALTADASGNVYISDSFNNRVRKVTASSGVISLFAGNGQVPPPAAGGSAISSTLNGPGSLGITPDGTLYFDDIAYIAAVSPGGTLTEDINANASTLAVDSQGNIYAIVAGGFGVFKYTPGASHQLLAGSLTQGTTNGTGDGGPATKATFSSLSAIAVDGAGNIYVADTGDQTVRKFAPGGNISTVAGFYYPPDMAPPASGPPIGDGASATKAPLQIATSAGTIAADSAGNLYIAELTNRIRKVTTNGIIQTYAGNGSSGNYLGDDGPALNATISPQAIAVDATGNLYISNVSNGGSRILKVSLPSASSLTLASPVMLPSASAGVPYSQQIPASVVSGGTPPYTFNLTGTVPSGIALSPSGLLTGTFLTAGSESLPFQVKDSAGLTASGTLQFSVVAGSLPTIAAVVNAAIGSSEKGGIAPGELVSIYGSNIGPATGVAGTVTNNSFPTTVSGVQVMFGAFAAPVLFVSSGQVNAVVPFEVSGSSVSVILTYNGAASAPFSSTVQTEAPGIFLIGSTQGAILNSDGTVNSGTNAASAGSYVVIFATGSGPLEPALVDGALDTGASTGPASIGAADVAVTIGGVPAQVLYAGAAPGLIDGVLQLNVVIPSGVTPGPAVPIILTIGSHDTTGGVTPTLGIK